MFTASKNPMRRLVLVRRFYSTKEPRKAQRSYITADEKKQNALDKFAYAVEENPEALGRISVNGTTIMHNSLSNLTQAGENTSF